MKSISPDLEKHVVHEAIDVPRITQLSAMYHRGLARHLCRAAGVPDLDLREVVHLPPHLVQAIYKKRIDDSFEFTHHGDWSASRALTAYSGSTTEPWALEGLQDVLRSLGWGDEKVGRVVHPDADLTRCLTLASEALKACWPEAWDEVNLLVDQIVYVDGPVRSATHQSTFGVIWAQVEEASDPELMFEMLLHEGGHHSLALREQFATFLQNPQDLATHAFRPDPRPLEGVLHAAFVMARMWSGLVKYRRAFGDAGPLEGTPLAEREQFTKDGLRAALETLDEHASWTPEGVDLFASLKQVAP